MFDIKIINSQGKQSKINQKMTKKKLATQFDLQHEY